MIRMIFHDPGGGEENFSVDAGHEFLVQGRDLSACSGKIRSFLDDYQLVRYGRAVIDDSLSLRGDDPRFPARLQEALDENARRVRGFLAELRGEGVERIEQLEELPQGYQSKTLHTVTHLLDGFFGIDSFFYNLVEGSHGVSEALKEKISSAPGDYMLVSVRASA
jgi:hypothetical protein